MQTESSPSQIVATLEQVHQKYQEWFYIEDTNRIDITLVPLVNQRLEGMPLWIFLVAPSGDIKTTQIEICDIGTGSFSTERLYNLTSRTLVSGASVLGFHIPF